MSKTTIYFITILSLAATAMAHGQTTYETRDFKLEKGGTVNVSQISVDWHPVLQTTEAPEPYGEADAIELAKVKKLISERYPPGRGRYAEKRQGQTAGPTLLRNFEGNIVTNSTPNDNHVAISNGDQLITVINTNIYIYDLVQDSLMKNVSLTAFFAPLAIVGPRSDPKVIYDPGADRFILMCFANSAPATSKLTVAFSATNDPMGVWNLYWLSGNPLNDTTWSDYPAMAVTNDEFFITINQVIPNQPWQTGFARTNIWQIDKNSGYNGNTTLTSRLWSDVRYNGTLVRYMCPVSGGSQNYGPNLYLLSNRNFAVQTDTIFLLEVTGLQSDTSTVVTVQQLSSNLRYSAPPNGREAGGQTLATNDARILGAFFENGQIQYVHNTLDTVTGFAGIYHGIIDNVPSNPTATGYILGDNILDFGYPNLAYTGKSPTDNSAIISFNYTAPTVNSGCTAILYDSTGNYSVNTNIKSGLNYVDVLLSSSERWGDYSGCQRKYNEPGKVWTADSWGRLDKTHGTWIAELTTEAPSSVESPNSPQLQGLVFPNPLKDMMSVKFDNQKDQQLFFEMYDSEGKLISVLLQDHVRKGENVFYFSTSPLSQGVYFLTIRSNAKKLFSQKIVKA